MTTTDSRPGVRVQGEGPTPRAGLSPEDRGERAVRLAAQVIGAVHYGTRRDVAQLLHRQDLVALTVALAAMVDPDKSPGELLAWTQPKPVPYERMAIAPRPQAKPPIPVAPCGFPNWHASYNRHKARCEAPCEDCLVGEREYQRNRPDRKAGARAGVST